MTPGYQPVEVECYSGYRANERPLAFALGGERYEVTGILDRWYEGGRTPQAPAIDYFKVRAAGGTFMLRYNRLFDAWGARRVD